MQTGHTLEFEFLSVPENAKAIQGRKGRETLCMECYRANLSESVGTVRYKVLETYTDTSHRYVECSQCGECISER